MIEWESGGDCIKAKNVIVNEREWEVMYKRFPLIKRLPEALCLVMYCSFHCLPPLSREVISKIMIPTLGKNYVLVSLNLVTSSVI